MEMIEFNGVVFRRYPDSKRRSDRVYFTPGLADRERGVKRLHQEIWMHAHGAIPEGAHIHHKDEDPLNNELSNLVLVTPKEHADEHWTPERSQRAREHAERIRPLAKAWHSSPEGLEWHRQHAYNSIRAIEPTEHTCDHCGAAFTAVPKKPNRFCSNACKSAWRRAAGLDNVERQCAVCGTTFVINRYAKAKSCSRACAGRLISRSKTSSP